MPRQARNFGPREPTIRFDNGTELRVSGGSGSATQFTAGAPGLRSIELPGEVDTSRAFDNALREIGAYEQETIHVDATGATGLRSPAQAPSDDTIELRPTTRGLLEPSVQVILYQDESGGLSWHFTGRQEAPPGSERGLRGRPAASPVFVIPLRTAEAQRSIRAGGAVAAKLRGPITKWGRKVFKVLVIPVGSALLEEPVQSIVGTIERKYRRDLVWAPNASTYAKPPTEPFNDWDRLHAKRSLLLIHGIFSTVEGMLSGLPGAFMDELLGRYGGRVLAYNHLSLMRSPEDNAHFFLEQAKRMAPSSHFEFDILCHSRGGIVARALAEQGAALLPDANCTFRKIFFVATPNNGSALGDAAHMVEMVDVFTNLLTAFPDGPVTYSIETLLAIVKLLAYSAQTSLPGLRAMGTDDYIQRVLNRSTQPSSARYAAAASDYDPNPTIDNGFFTGPFAQKIVGRVFRQGGDAVSNDLVVPERGVYGDNGHPSFPIANPLRFTPSDHVWHSGFFHRPKLLSAIRRHFEMPEGTVTDPGERPKSGLRSGSAQPPRGAPGPDALRRPTRGAYDTTHSSFQEETRADGGVSLQIRRTPAIDAPEVVAEGSETDVVVCLQMPAVLHDFTTSFPLVFDPGDHRIVLSVILKAPGFEIIGANHRDMSIERERNAETEKVTFRVKAEHPGAAPKTRQLTAEFWKGNNAVGEVTREMIVVPAGYGGSVILGSSSTSTVQVPTGRREDCDLAIKVRGREPVFELSLRCSVSGEEYEDREVGNFDFRAAELPLYTRQILDERFASYPRHGAEPAAFQEWNADFMEYLRDFGKALWTMLPEQFRTEYLRLRASLRSIVVYSNELVFPWELVRPFPSAGKFENYEFFGAAHVLGRWQPKLGLRPRQQRVPISRFVVMRPRYSANDLDWADGEVTALAEMITSAEQLKPVTKAQVRTLLGRNDVQMVHFTGHGEYQDNADLNALCLEDGNFPALSLRGTRLGLEAQPILYLNACSLGKTGPTPGRMGGFAANCLEGGWSGVIAPYWLINDESAARFSRLLYAKLKANRSIGEALQELRAENPDDPTFLAYSYIGDPWARPLLP